ncbi:substrate-binding periplasmic protein [Oceanospirillum maris]|jgi:ABC-type amino acid transport substrate-binding protein|uniref:substrate-binding periplasmic protein n=1 Tax=Oceanospirillum maris TaxID=64977 RepID=UPI0004814295|nr:transporter substrate-binding domain-containing protein [Oceanospirillum maris]
MKKPTLITRLVTGLALVVITVSQAWCAPLLVGIIDSPLLGYYDEKQRLRGFEAELAQQICSKLEHQCQFVIQTFAKNIEGVRLGHLDMALSSILVTDNRKKTLLFSQRYMRSVSSYVGVPDKQPKYRPIHVAVIKRSVQEHFLRQNFNSSIKVVAFDQNKEMYQALKENRVDQVLAPSIVQLGFLSNDNSGRFDLIGEPLDNPKLSGDIAVAIHQQKPSLKDQVDKALTDLLIDGSYNHLNNKYFPFNTY